MAPPKEYTSHDIELVQRLTAVETTLQAVAQDVANHRSVSEKRSDELRDMLRALGTKVEAGQWRWPALLNRDVLKIVAYIVLSTAGLTAAAKAVLP